MGCHVETSIGESFNSVCCPMSAREPAAELSYRVHDAVKVLTLAQTCPNHDRSFHSLQFSCPNNCLNHTIASNTVISIQGFKAAIGTKTLVLLNSLTFYKYVSYSVFKKTILSYAG